MAYVTISMWEADDAAVRDAALENARISIFPAVRALGAVRIRSVALSDTRAMLITDWPDQATRDAAMERIQSMRTETSSAIGIRMTAEHMGEVLLEG